VTLALGDGVLMERRPEWGARPPRSRTAFTADYGSTSHWEGPAMGDFPHSSCATKVRVIQAFHMDTRGWSDIAYTALVCPHGVVYEGRWIGVRTAANGTNEGNSAAYAICYLGGVGDGFTEAGKRAMRAVQRYLDAHGGAGPGKNCHRDWKPTECPGDLICTWVRAGMPVTPMTPPGGLTMAQIDDIYERLGAIERSIAGTAKRTQVGDRYGGVIGRVEQMRQAVAEYHRREMAAIAGIDDAVLAAISQLRAALPADDAFDGSVAVPTSAIRTLVSGLGLDPDAPEPEQDSEGAVEPDGA
jgi:hypothetical protein